MANLHYVTAGESHGQGLTVIVTGMPADLTVDVDLIDRELVRRQGGFGRGDRMRIEQDAVAITAGLRNGKTLGSPLALQIGNRDVRIDEAPALYRPRPGHADLSGSLKFVTTDCRNVLERASARETAARVAAGALTRSLLSVFGIRVVGHVVQIHDASADVKEDITLDELLDARAASEVYCADREASARMIDAIRAAKRAKDTVGGVVEVWVEGHPPGLGTCMQAADRLDGRLAQCLVAIPSVKGVEIGLGFGGSSLLGSQVHDAIGFSAACRGESSVGFTRPTNRAGGLEGGMTNGQRIVVRAALKPISTLGQGLESVDLPSKKAQRSDYERSDICAVSAGSVVAENVVAFEIARAMVDKFAGDTLAEMAAAHAHYLDMLRQL